MTTATPPQAGFNFSAPNLFAGMQDERRYPQSAVSLRPYQLAALTASEAAYELGAHRQGIALPTGTGKTVVFSELIRRRGGRAVILAHRDELIKQAAAKLSTVAPGIHIGTVKAEKDQVWATVVVASVQTLSHPKRLARLMLQGPFTSVVVDEAHHAAAETYRRVLAGLVTERTLLFGVSATWDRADRKGLSGIFEDIVYEYDLLQAIAEGYLSDIRAKQVKLAVSFSGLKITKGDFAANASEKLLEEANAPAYAVKAYRQDADGRKALLFAPTVASAMAFADAFDEAGYKVGTVWGDQPEGERAKALADFHSGAIQILTNCAVLTEGYDEPAIDCVIVARPTRSRSLYAQMIGRGTRPYPGKADLLVLDLVGATARHDLITTATLLGQDAKKLEQKGASELKQEEEKKQAIKGERLRVKREASNDDHAQELEGARVISEHVDLFQRRDLHWGGVGGVFTLAVGDGVISVREGDSGWQVDLVPTRGVKQTLMSGLDLGYAQGYAEDYARRNGKAYLTDPNAGWRNKPMTEKQMGNLVRLRVPLGGITTAGEASDKISAALAQGRGGRR